MKPREIKGARVRMGYGQQFMADQMGISLYTYQKKESGHVRFTDVEKAKLIDILDLTMSQANDFLYDGLLPLGK